MRLFLMLVVSFFTTSVFAQEMICERQVSNTRTEYTVIDTWPTLVAQMGYKDCMGNGGFEICFEKGLGNVADQTQVCGYNMNPRWDCQTRRFRDNQGNTYVDTQCPRWNVTARLQVSRNGQGRLTCMRGNHVERRWRLGSCY